MRTHRRLLATVILGAALVAAGCSSGESSSDPSGTGATPTEAEPSSAVIDQAFVDAIESCERLVVTPKQVGSAFDIRVEDPAPSRSAGVLFGCEYASPDQEEGGGQVVISAYTTASPPPPLSQSEPVRGIGDEASFLPWAGATSILEVRTGDLILRFDAGGIKVAEDIGVGDAWLPPLRSVAEDALSTLEEDA